MREVVIVSGARTAIGDYMGSLSGFNPVQLGVFALKGAIAKAGIDKNIIEEVIAVCIYRPSTVRFVHARLRAAVSGDYAGQD